MNKETLKQKVTRLANNVNFRHYRSTPMPRRYSKPFHFFADKATPNQMQNAFIKAVLH
ncbi:hypothetical protein [Caudoviricetes sp.]|nr:hypothetical protein [Caudoviricetes sp.]